MKRRWFAAAAIALLAALLSYGTLAYFTAERRAENTITTGYVDVEIMNLLSGQPQRDAVLTFMPGDRVENTVSVRNTGAHPAFVRVALNVAVNAAALDPSGCIEVNIDSSEWIYREGYYYYHRVLEAQEEALLFSEVYFDGRAIDNAYLGKVLTMEIHAYGVQSENNGTDPLAAIGWPG